MCLERWKTEERFEHTYRWGRDKERESEPWGKKRVHRESQAGSTILRAFIWGLRGRIFISFPRRASSGSWSPLIGWHLGTVISHCSWSWCQSCHSAWFYCFSGPGAKTQLRSRCHLKGFMLKGVAMQGLVGTQGSPPWLPSAPGLSFLLCSSLSPCLLHEDY